MRDRNPVPVASPEGTTDLFRPWSPSHEKRIGAEHVAAYIAALEERCNTLWTYMQGHDSQGDPVVRFLAADFASAAQDIDLAAGRAAD